jgi:hypothetical protein
MAKRSTARFVLQKIFALTNSSNTESEKIAMSAENWARCPQCRILRALRIEKMDTKVKAAYGVVSAEEYLLMRKAAEQARNKKPDASLAEYYTIGVDADGKFYVKYHGKCETCGFDHKFEHEEQMEFEDGV